MFKTDGPALVTGAGGGLGRALAVSLARRGMPVIPTDVHVDRLEQTVAAIRAIGGIAHPHRLDVRDAEAVQALAEQVHATHGPLGLLANNAGVAVAGGVVGTPVEDWRWIVDINLMGVVHGCAAFVPAMVQAPGRRQVVNIASAAGLGGVPQLGAYCATKAAVLALSESLAGEHSPDALGVTVVCPGFFPTGIGANGRMPDDVRELARRLLDRRGRSPEQVAAAILRAVDRRRGRLILFPEAYLALGMRSLPGRIARPVRRALARRLR